MKGLEADFGGGEGEHSLFQPQFLRPRVLKSRAKNSQQPAEVYVQQFGHTLELAVRAGGAMLRGWLQQFFHFPKYCWQLGRRR